MVLTVSQFSRRSVLRQQALWWLPITVVIPLGLVVLLTNDRRAEYSSSSAMAAVLGATAVYWPIVLAMASAVMVRNQRLGVNEMIRAAGGNAVLRDYATRWLVLGLAAVAGLVAVFLIGGVVGVVHGSPWTFARIPDLIANCFMTFALVAAGLTVGMLAPWRLVPLLLAAGLYLAFAFSWFGVNFLFVYGDITSDAITYAITKLWSVAWFVGLAFAISLVAVAVAWWGHSKSWLAVAFSLVGVFAVLGTGHVVASLKGDSVYYFSQSDTWECRAVRTDGSSVCLPSDQVRDLDMIVSHATLIDESLNELASKPVARDYSPDMAEPSMYHLPLVLPLGDDSPEVFALAVYYAAFSLSSACWDQNGNPQGGITQWDIWEAEYLVGQWVNPSSGQQPPMAPDRPPPPSQPDLEQARKAYLLLENCWL